MFNTHFAPRGRNINGEILDIHFEPNFCLSVSYWGKLGDTVTFYRRPQSQRYVTFPVLDVHTQVPQELCVAHIFNLKPGKDDFWPAEKDDEFPNRIRVWNNSIEVEPVVINERTGEVQECPGWFSSTLQTLRSRYMEEAQAFRRLVGDRFSERAAQIEHPLLRVIA